MENRKITVVKNPEQIEVWDLQKVFSEFNQSYCYFYKNINISTDVSILCTDMTENFSEFEKGINEIFKAIDE